MNKLNDWLTLVANISVVAGIVFLAYEISQNTEALGINAAQALTSEQAEFHRSMTNPEIAAVLARVDNEGYESLSDVQKWQLTGLDNVWLHIYQNSYHQFISGNLDTGIWLGQHRGAIASFRAQGNLRASWKLRGFAFSDEFRRYIEDEVLPEALSKTPS